jgi:prophage antirepressor-like protein
LENTTWDSFAEQFEDQIMLASRSRSPRRDVPFVFDETQMMLVLRGTAAKILTFENDSNELWFRAKPIVVFLDYGVTHVSQTIDRLDSDEKMCLEDLYNMKGRAAGVELFNSSTLGYHDKKAIYISESGLYSLILGSKNPEAKPFKRWITHEVLPAFRRHGCYVVEQQNKRRRVDELQEIVSTIMSSIDERLSQLKHKQFCGSHFLQGC